LESRHTDQINPTTVSAEEFPWKSTQQGGESSYVFPATTEEQNSMSTGPLLFYENLRMLTRRIGQGGTVGGAYTSNGIDLNSWFRITFTGG
jgi:hypothetical protein